MLLVPGQQQREVKEGIRIIRPRIDRRTVAVARCAEFTGPLLQKPQIEPSLCEARIPRKSLLVGESGLRRTALSIQNIAEIERKHWVPPVDAHSNAVESLGFVEIPVLLHSLRPLEKLISILEVFS